MRIACLFRGNLRDENRNKENFDLVVKSIYKLFDIEDIDFYMHLWGSEDEYNIYNSHFDKDKILIENNKNYHDLIYKIFNYNKINHTFGQISMALSLKKVSNLFYNTANINKYDMVFITRPDLVFSQKNDIQSINEDAIYFNRHGPYKCSGDYCFLMRPSNVSLYGNIFNFLLENPSFEINIHKWIYSYITDICGKNVELSNVDVGVNCEIFHHLYNFPYPHILDNIYKFTSK